jgi:hypothetical protein
VVFGLRTPYLRSYMTKWFRVSSILRHLIRISFKDLWFFLNQNASKSLCVMVREVIFGATRYHGYMYWSSINIIVCLSCCISYPLGEVEEYGFTRWMPVRCHGLIHFFLCCTRSYTLKNKARFQVCKKGNLRCYGPTISHNFNWLNLNSMKTNKFLNHKNVPLNKTR